MACSVLLCGLYPFWRSVFLFLREAFLVFVFFFFSGVYHNGTVQSRASPYLLIRVLSLYIQVWLYFRLAIIQLQCENMYRQYRQCLFFFFLFFFCSFFFFLFVCCCFFVVVFLFCFFICLFVCLFVCFFCFFFCFVFFFFFLMIDLFRYYISADIHGKTMCC